MSIIVYIIAGVATLMGLILLALVSRPEKTAPRVCASCRSANPPHAAYCGHCGRGLVG